MILGLKINHRLFYFLGCAIIAAGMSFSNVAMSVGAITLIVNWILEGEYKSKFKSFAGNKSLLVFIGLFFLHLIGLFYTSDFTYAMNDIRIKAVLLALPIILGTMPEKFEYRDIRRLLYIFVSGVFVSSLISTGVYFHVLSPNAYTTDTRQIFILVSHVRMGLMLAFAIFILCYLFYKNNTSLKPVHTFLAVWFLFFIYISESFTGAVSLVAGGIILMSIYVFRLKKKPMKWVSAILAVGVLTAVSLYINQIVQKHYTPKEDKTDLAQFSPDGEKYHHDLNNDITENGYYIFKNIAPGELMESWNQRSDIDFKTGEDRNGNRIAGTLIRYMSSKGLRKDRNGVEQLSEDDIQNIENGIANIDYAYGGISRRIDEFLFEYDVYLHDGNASNSSAIQRIEYWKTGWYIFKKNSLFGVGTGDTKMAFDKAYNMLNSQLPKDQRNRAHNQFLTFMITFGVIGFILSAICIFYPVIAERKQLDFLFLSFFVVGVLSFLWEDTLETQLGVTFFAFFYSLFLFGRKGKSTRSQTRQVVSDSLLDSES